MHYLLQKKSFNVLKTGQFNLVFSPTKIYCMSGTPLSLEDMETTKLVSAFQELMVWLSAPHTLMCFHITWSCCIGYLLLRNEWPQHSAAGNNKHLSSQIVAEGLSNHSWVIQEWLTWLILAWGRSWGWSQHVGGCSHLKAEIDSLARPKDSLARWCTPMTIGRRPQFLAMWASPQIKCLSILMTWQLGSPTVSNQFRSPLWNYSTCKNILSHPAIIFG